MKVKKLERDGKIAVVYSPSFGSGLSTWNEKHKEELIFDEKLAYYVEKKDKKKCIKRALEIDPDCYIGSAFENLAICWVEKGKKFRIAEYDGSESVEIFDELDHFIA